MAQHILMSNFAFGEINLLKFMRIQAVFDITHSTVMRNI